MATRRPLVTIAGVIQELPAADQLRGAKNLPFYIPPTGEDIYTTNGAGGATGTVAGAANRIDLFPWVPRGDFTSASLVLNCTTLLAAALAKFVVYGSDLNDRPNALLLETGTVDLSTTGLKPVAGVLSWVNGQTYWLGVRHSSTASISTWLGTATPDIHAGVLTTAAKKSFRRTLAFATAAPASWVPLSSEVNAALAPAIGIRM